MDEVGPTDGHVVIVTLRDFAAKLLEARESKLNWKVWSTQTGETYLYHLVQDGLGPVYMTSNLYDQNAGSVANFFSAVNYDFAIIEYMDPGKGS